MAGIVSGAMPQGGQPQAAQEQAPKAGRQAAPRDMLMAVQGALFDSRANGADRIIAAAKNARDPASSIVNSILDVVQHVAEKAGYAGGGSEILPVIMLVMGQMLELALAAGIQVSREQFMAAAQQMTGGQQPAQPQGQQGVMA